MDARHVSVPAGLGDLTADWFTGILRARGSTATVSSIEVVEAHSGTTGRARVRLSYADGAAGAPERLFVKLAPFDERQRAFIRFTGIGESEARFYSHLGAEVPVRVPAVWHAGLDGAGGYVMVLEDLVASGCRFPARAEADARERAASTVEELAHLHAAYWESDRFGADLAWVPERAGFGGLHDRDEVASAAAWLVRQALDRFTAEMPPAFQRVGELYASRTADILDLWDEGERTLVHGDCHVGNLFVDGTRTGFYDWAMVSRSPAVRDVAYTCCYSMTPEARRAQEVDLLRRYRDVLASSGIAVDPAGLEEQYRFFAVFAWVSATSTAVMGTRWQREELAYGAMERATEAVADLESVEITEKRLA